jgi:hypothetical protein
MKKVICIFTVHNLHTYTLLYLTFYLTWSCTADETSLIFYIFTQNLKT